VERYWEEERKRVVDAKGDGMKRKELASRIDHTILGPKATREGVRILCEEAVSHGAASACVDPCYAMLAKGFLASSPVKLCVVVGFPSGMATTEAKAFEAQKAIADGADELDMVVNVAALTDRQDNYVRADIAAVCDVAKAAPRPVHIKVILETALLTDEEKERGARIAVEAGANFVKTSTGFGPGGATVEDIALLRQTVGPDIGVKASGGIRDYATAIAMIEAGASRIGASRTVAILEGAED